MGKTGVGKSYFAAAVADSACRSGNRAAFYRVPRLLEELALARAAGEYGALLGKLSRVHVLALDDFLLNPMTKKTWHEALVDPTIADAICDRLVHNAQVLKLGGPSLRRKNAIPAEKTATQNPS